MLRRAYSARAPNPHPAQKLAKAWSIEDSRAASALACADRDAARAPPGFRRGAADDLRAARAVRASTRPARAYPKMDIAIDVTDVPFFSSSFGGTRFFLAATRWCVRPARRIHAGDITMTSPRARCNDQIAGITRKSALAGARPTSRAVVSLEAGLPEPGRRTEVSQSLRLGAKRSRLHEPFSNRVSSQFHPVGASQFAQDRRADRLHPLLGPVNGLRHFAG